MRAPALIERALAAGSARFDRTPIRLKLALVFAGAMVALFGLLFLLIYIQFAQGLDDGVNSSLRARAADLASLGADTRSELAAHRLPPAPDGFAQILGPAGQVLAATAGRHRQLLDPAELALARHGRVYLKGPDGTQLLAEPATRPSRNLLLVGVSTHDRDSALDSLQRLMFIGGPIALLIACFAGYFVAARALASVERMRRRADELFSTEDSARLPVPSARDEIQQLGQTLNEMLDRVEEVVDRGREFVAGASHELRTPLTILQLELDDALAGERTREDLEESVASAREEVRRLTSLAEDLLVIAQGDQQRLPIVAERFEVHGAMRAIAERYSHLEGAAGRRVVVLNGMPLFVEADLARVDMAVSNLVNNGLRYGAGDVEMRASRRGGEIELHVLDRGPGFPPEFLPHAFERFARADPARSRGGSGLGLAIVQAIAEAHGGRVQAANREGGGAHVWLTLPAVRGREAPVDGAPAEPVGRRR
jgi:signal transduction histidine kinase